MYINVQNVKFWIYTSVVVNKLDRDNWRSAWNFLNYNIIFFTEATVVYRDGLPVFSVPLPSRRQSCEFTMKPVTHTVGKFLSFLKEEDGGIDRAAIFTEGKRMICIFYKILQEL